MRSHLLIILLLACLASDAQERNMNWYFGNSGQLSFSGGIPVQHAGNPQRWTGPSSAVSDENTGRALFYTNGLSVWEAAGNQLMAGGASIAPGGSQPSDVIIVPDPASSSDYYIFICSSPLSQLAYTHVSMNKTTGKGQVAEWVALISVPSLAGKITAVSYIHSKGYWVIARSQQGNTYYAFRVTEKGVDEKPVLSNAGQSFQSNSNAGQFVSSQRGDLLGITNYSSAGGFAEVLHFDKRCGRVSNAIALAMRAGWDYPLGIGFSPDASKVYASYSYAKSQLVQYSGNNFSGVQLVAESPENFNAMQMAPDGRMYIATHTSGLPGGKIDVIAAPDKLYPACDYRKTEVDMGVNAPYFYFPNMLNDFSMDQKPLPKISFTISTDCAGTAQFNTSGDGAYDSIRWDFGDPASGSNNSSAAKAPAHYYPINANYKVVLRAYSCSFTEADSQQVVIRSAPKPALGPDLITCAGSSVQLDAGTAAEQYKWWPGNEQTRSISAKGPGRYIVRASNGPCDTYDTIVISNYPSIALLLGDEYFICSRENELVKLDAGEGFQNYKWTPTGDTTQWIEVADLGDYFVVVKDFRGCEGDAGTKVKQRCPVTLYFPNSFTPNNDGINDRYVPAGSDVTAYNLRVYNRWGQQVFESSSLAHTWDGTINGQHAPDGVYFYMANYSGYVHKQLASFDTKGNISLLR